MDCPEEEEESEKRIKKEKKEMREEEEKKRRRRMTLPPYLRCGFMLPLPRLPPLEPALPLEMRRWQPSTWQIATEASPKGSRGQVTMTKTQ